MDTSASKAETDQVETMQPVAIASAEALKIDELKIDGDASRIPDFSIFKIFRRAGASCITAITARPRLSRVTILAASIAVAAALGSMVGAWAAVAFVRPPTPPVPTVIANADKAAIARLSADIAALKTSIDSMAKSSAAQYARINERVERSEKAQGEPAAKIAKLADAVEKLERKSAAVPIPVPAPAAAPEITGSIVPKQQDKPPVVTGWVLREVFDGAAMVESRHGLYEVVPGAKLPGLGRVETIRRQDGRWVVVTPKGIIVSSR
jgi:hypothetical protein